MSRKNKTISFNELDPNDLSLLNHAEQINPLTGKEQNFSKYVKRLIEEDMRKVQPGDVPELVMHEEVDFSVDDEKINSFL